MSGALSLAQAALEGWAWADARDAFMAALAEQPSVAAYEGLAQAAMGLDDLAGARDAFEQAYRLARGAGDREGAARAAVGLGELYIDPLARPAVGLGWLRRARRLLEADPGHPTLGWVDGLESYEAWSYARDFERAKQLAVRAQERARAIGDTQLELMAVGFIGLTLVSSGRVREGMPMIDEVIGSVVAGDLRDVRSAATALCMGVTAFARTRDLARAAQWSREVMNMTRDLDSPAIFNFPRVEHAGLLIAWGRYADAEVDLQAVVDDGRTRPVEAARALMALAELYRRQGRHAESAGFLERLADHPGRTGLVERDAPVRARLALDLGQPTRAATIARRYLDVVGPDAVLDRLDALAVLAEALVTAGGGPVDGVAAELAAIAELVGTDPVCGTAWFAAGLAARSQGDRQGARAEFDRAALAFEAVGMPLEGGRSRLELARDLELLGDLDAARLEAERACTALQPLGPPPAFAEAQRLTATLDRRRHRAPGIGPLSRRETEVLRLIAAGRSNEEIAAELVLSVRTVERHVSNIYAKIGAYGRASRAMAAAFAHAHRLS